MCLSGNWTSFNIITRTIFQARQSSAKRSVRPFWKVLKDLDSLSPASNRSAYSSRRRDSHCLSWTAFLAYIIRLSPFMLWISSSFIFRHTCAGILNTMEIVLSESWRVYLVKNWLFLLGFTNSHVWGIFLIMFIYIFIYKWTLFASFIDFYMFWLLSVGIFIINKPTVIFRTEFWFL